VVVGEELVVVVVVEVKNKGQRRGVSNGDARLVGSPRYPTALETHI
jgi:hypothetical protein